jgi:hypothetical protein
MRCGAALHRIAVCLRQIMRALLAAAWCGVAQRAPCGMRLHDDRSAPVLTNANAHHNPKRARARSLAPHKAGEGRREQEQMANTILRA